MPSLDDYSRAFFWIFVLLGVMWGFSHQEALDYYFTTTADHWFEKTGRFVKEDLLVPAKPGGIDSLEALLWALLKIVLIIAIGIIFIILWAAAIVLFFALWFALGVLYLLKLHIILVGAIFFYPFYVLFLNVFEMFLVLLIRHPAAADIQLLLRSRDVDYDLLKRIAEKVDIPIRANPPELAAHVLTRHLRKVRGLVGLELWPVRSLRMAKLHQALESAY